MDRRADLCYIPVMLNVNYVYFPPQIPLYGYGGKSCVILENVKKHCNRYLVELNELSPGKISQVSFSLRNTGSRAAYVKALCFRNFCERIIMDPRMLRVFPEKFVIKEGEQQVSSKYSPSIFVVYCIPLVYCMNLNSYNI